MLSLCPITLLCLLGLPHCIYGHLFNVYYVHFSVNESLKLPFAAIALPMAALLLTAIILLEVFWDYTRDLEYIDVCMFLKQLFELYFISHVSQIGVHRWFPRLHDLILAAILAAIFDLFLYDWRRVYFKLYDSIISNKFYLDAMLCYGANAFIKY